jgi:hypothetical protein
VFILRIKNSSRGVSIAVCMVEEVVLVSRSGRTIVLYVFKFEKVIFWRGGGGCGALILTIVCTILLWCGCGSGQLD